MLANVLGEFECNCKYINDFVDLSESLNRLKPPRDTVGKLSKKLLQTRKGRRILTYSGCIISLYGCFEYFIEELVKAHCNFLSEAHASYADMPSSIKNKNFELSLDFSLALRRSSKFEDVDQLKKNVITNLSACIQSETPFYLNEEAFAHHSSNFRCDGINDVFNRLAIEKASEHAVSTKEYESKLVDDIESKGLKQVQTETFDAINQLAERRNTTGHTMLDESDLLSPDEISNYVCHLKAFAHGIVGLVAIVQRQLLVKMMVKETVFSGRPENVFGKTNVISFVGSSSISEDHLVLMKRVKKSEYGTLLYYELGKLEEVRHLVDGDILQTAEVSPDAVAFCVRPSFPVCSGKYFFIHHEKFSKYEKLWG